MDSEKFEREILKLAFETDIRITVATVAYYFGIPSRDARVKLDELIDAGLLELDSDRDGNLFYKLHQEAGSAVAGHIESLIAPTSRRPATDDTEQEEEPARRPSISETLSYSPPKQQENQSVSENASSDSRTNHNTSRKDTSGKAPRDITKRNERSVNRRNARDSYDDQDPYYEENDYDQASCDDGDDYRDEGYSRRRESSYDTEGYEPNSDRRRSRERRPDAPQRRRGYRSQDSYRGRQDRRDNYRYDRDESPYGSMGYADDYPPNNYGTSSFIIADNASCDARTAPYQNNYASYPATVYTTTTYTTPSDDYYREQQHEALMPLPHDQKPEQIDLNRKHHPAIAVLLSLCLPGAGQFYNGQIEKGVFMMLMTFLSWMAFFGWAFQLWSIFDALVVASKIRSTQDAHREQLERNEAMMQRRAITTTVKRYHSNHRRR